MHGLALVPSKSGWVDFVCPVGFLLYLAQPCTVISRKCYLLIPGQPRSRSTPILEIKVMCQMTFLVISDCLGIFPETSGHALIRDNTVVCGPGEFLGHPGDQDFSLISGTIVLPSSVITPSPSRSTRLKFRCTSSILMSPSIPVPICQYRNIILRFVTVKQTTKMAKMSMFVIDWRIAEMWQISQPHYGIKGTMLKKSIFVEHW